MAHFTFFTFRLSYSSTAIDLIVVAMHSKPCLEDGTYHFLPNPLPHDPNPDPNLLSPLCVLVALPNQF